MRDKTEQPESVESGVVTLVATDPQRIIHHYTQLIGNSPAEEASLHSYRDDHAADGILDASDQYG